MISQQELKELLVAKLPGTTLPEATILTEVEVELSQYHQTAETLHQDEDLKMDYLIDCTAVDRDDHFTLVLHLASTKHPHVVVLKTDIPGRDHPQVDSLADIWATAEFQEREIFDLFGIEFKNHPDPRKLFCEEEYGHPLRKDFRDEINMIER